MPVQFQSTPVANTTGATLQLWLAGANQLAINPHDATTTSVSCDQILVFDPPNPVAGFMQNPPAAIAIPPGNLAYFSRAVGPARVLLQYGPPGGNQTTIQFT